VLLLKVNWSYKEKSRKKEKKIMGYRWTDSIQEERKRDKSGLTLNWSHLNSCDNIFINKLIVSICFDSSITVILYIRWCYAIDEYIVIFIGIDEYFNLYSSKLCLSVNWWIYDIFINLIVKFIGFNGWINSRFFSGTCLFRATRAPGNVSCGLLCYPPWFGED
jgi:hypothetical protein